MQVAIYTQERNNETEPSKESTLSKLTKHAHSLYDEDESLIKMFNGDGKSDVTLTVWDFGGQQVRIAHGWVGEKLESSIPPHDLLPTTNRLSTRMLSSGLTDRMLHNLSK